MRIAMVYNPRSGRGKGERLAAEMSGLCRARGHTLVTHDMLADPGLIEETIAGSQRVLVVGGDGTVHHLLPILARCGVPAYHCGTGTANLIGREFGMSRSPARVVDDLEREHAPLVVDLPLCNGMPFLIMVSMGIDASVIHRFEESRRRGGYRAYVGPVIREVLGPRPASYTLTVDDPGSTPFSATGILVIANMRSYGGGLNPCGDAICDDGLLDAVSMPCTTSVGAGWRYAMLLAGISTGAVKRVVSSAFMVEGRGGASCVQVDGEKASRVPGLEDGMLRGGWTLRVTMSGEKILMHAPGAAGGG